MNDFNLILTILSAIGAFLAGLFAWKSYENYKYSNLPILVPFITDSSNPHLLKLKIINNGNGIAKNIVMKLHVASNEPATDLLPRKFNDFLQIEWEVDLNFDNGNNPLFTNPNFEITYTDIFGKKLKTIAKFKPDVNPERKLLGHLDKNFIGYSFEGYEDSIEYN